jgi:hypothetical protein
LHLAFKGLVSPVDINAFFVSFVHQPDSALNIDDQLPSEFGISRIGAVNKITILVVGVSEFCQLQILFVFE